MSEPKSSSDRADTVRHALRAALSSELVSAYDLSARVGASEKDVVYHLEHLARTLARENARLVVDPARCESCAFVFKKRDRLSTPSRCPVCRSERISPPRFALEVKAR